MAEAFQITAQLVLVGPDTTAVKRNLQQQLSGLKLGGFTQQVNTLTEGTNKLNKASQNAAVAMSGVQKSTSRVAESTKKATSAMASFGQVSGLAIRRFSGFTIATTIVFGFLRAITQAAGQALDFETQMIKVSQVTRTSLGGLRGLRNEIDRLSTTLGVAREDLGQISLILSQAGLSARETKLSLEALAKSTLAPTFTDIRRTAEGAIAIMNQFKIGADQLGVTLGSVNAVAGQFAVESDDLIAAVRRTGGVFAAASKDIRDTNGRLLTGLERFQQFIALFTSVRGTTRESAESIATGLRTIFTRIQRRDTIENLRALGIELQDLEGRFIGPFEAVNRLGTALRRLNPRDQRFADIAEQLGGFRQIGKTIPLILEGEKRLKALRVAQEGQDSLNKDVEKSLQGLQRRFGLVREEFKELILEFTETDTFRILAKTIIELSSALISLAKTFKEILPILTIIGGIRLLGAGRAFVGRGGFFSGLTGGRGRGFQSGGLIPGASRGRDHIPVAADGGEFIVRSKQVTSQSLPVLRAINQGKGVFAQQGFGPGNRITAFQNAFRNVQQPTASVSGRVQRSFFSKLLLVLRDLGRKVSGRGFTSGRTLSEIASTNRTGIGFAGALLGPQIESAIGQQTAGRSQFGAGVGGAATGGALGAFLGLGPVGIAGAAGFGAVTGAARGEREFANTQAQNALVQSTKALDSAFKEFERTGNLNKLNDALGLLDVSIDKAAQAQRIEGGGTFGFLQKQQEAFEETIIGKISTAIRGPIASITNFKVAGEQFEVAKRGSIVDVFNPSAKAFQRRRDIFKGIDQEQLQAFQGRIAQQSAQAGAFFASQIQKGKRIQDVLKTTQGQQFAGAFVSGTLKTTGPEGRLLKRLTGLSAKERGGVAAQAFTSTEAGRTLIKQARLQRDLESAMDAVNRKIQLLTGDFETMSAIAQQAGQRGIQFIRANQAIDARFGGGTAITQRVRTNVFANPRAFSTEALQRGFVGLQADLGESSQLRELRQTVIGTQRLQRELPAFINQLSQQSALAPEDLQSRLLGKLQEFGLPPQLVEEAKEVVKTVEVLGDLKGGEIREFVDKIAGIGDVALKAANDLEKGLIEGNKKYIEAVNQQVRLQVQLNERVANRAALGAGLRSQEAALFGNRRQTLRERLAPGQVRLRSRLGPGFQGNIRSLQAISANIGGLIDQRRFLERQPATLENIDALKDLELAINNNRKALEFLGKDTTKLAFIQEKILQIQKSRAAAETAALDFTQLDPAQQMERALSALRALQVERTGILPGGLAGKRALAGIADLNIGATQEEIDARRRRFTEARFRNIGFTPAPGGKFDPNREEQFRKPFRDAARVQEEAQAALINLDQKQIDIRANNATINLHMTGQALQEAARGQRANIPQEIVFIGKHEVNVVINGAKVLQELKPGIQQLVINGINKAMKEQINPVTGETNEGFDGINNV